MKEIMIGRPEISYDVAHAVLSAPIRENDKENEMYFRVESEFGKYLCADVADPFLIAILPYALEKGIDIEIEEKIAEQLYYQLTIPDSHTVKI